MKTQILKFKQWKAWIAMLMACCALGTANAVDVTTGTTTLWAHEGVVTIANGGGTTPNLNDCQDGAHQTVVWADDKAGNITMSFDLNVLQSGNYTIRTYASTGWGHNTSTILRLDDANIKEFQLTNLNGWCTNGNKNPNADHTMDICAGTHTFSLFHANNGIGIYKFEFIRNGNATGCSGGGGDPDPGNNDCEACNSTTLVNNYQGGYPKTEPEQWTITSTTTGGIALTGCGGDNPGTPANIVDNNTGTIWSAWQNDNDCANRPIFLTIDTKEERWFSQMVLRTNNNDDYAGTETPIRLYGRNNTTDAWTQITGIAYSKAGGGADRRDVLTFGAVKYRYIEIRNDANGNSGGGGHWNISEMYLHYTADPATCADLCEPDCEKPTTPTFTAGETSICPNTSGLVYTIESVTGATYEWTVPTGWTITAGEGTNSITVTAGAAAEDVEVKATVTVDECTSDEAVRPVDVTSPETPAVIVPAGGLCRGNLNDETTLQELGIDQATDLYWFFDNTSTEGGVLVGSGNKFTAGANLAENNTEGINVYIRRKSGDCWSDPVVVKVVSAHAGVLMCPIDIVTIDPRDTNPMFDPGTGMLSQGTGTDAAYQWYEIPAGQVDGMNAFYYKNVATGRYIYDNGANCAGGNPDWRYVPGDKTTLTEPTPATGAAYKFVKLAADGGRYRLILNSTSNTDGNKQLSAHTALPEYPTINCINSNNNRNGVETFAITKVDEGEYVCGVGEPIPCPPAYICNSVTANAGEDATIKIIETLPLSAGALAEGTAGAWTIETSPAGNQGNISNATLPNAIFTPGAVGQYTLRWTVSNTNEGCTDVTDFDEITVIVNPECNDVQPGLTIRAENATICAGTATNIILENSQTGVIYGLYAGSTLIGTELTGTGGNLFFATGAITEGTAFRIRTTTANDDFCPNITIGSEVTVSISATSVAGTVAAEETTVLQGEGTTITLTGYTGTTIQWQYRFNDGEWTDTGDGVATLATGNLNTIGTYQYRAVVTSGVCPAETTAMVATVTVIDPTTIDEDAGAACNEVPTVYMLVNSHSGRYMYDNGAASNVQLTNGNTGQYYSPRSLNRPAPPAPVSALNGYWVSSSEMGSYGTWRNLSTGNYLTRNDDNKNQNAGDNGCTVSAQAAATNNNLQNWRYEEENAANGGEGLFDCQETTSYAHGEPSAGNGDQTNRNVYAVPNTNTGNLYEGRGTRRWHLVSAPNPFDLSVESVTASKAFVETANIENNSFTATAVIKNTGTANITETIKVKFAFNGQFFYATVPSLNAGAEAEATVTITPIFLTEGAPVEVTVNSDNNILFERSCANNTLASSNVRVVEEIICTLPTAMAVSISKTLICPTDETATITLDGTSQADVSYTLYNGTSEVESSAQSGGGELQWTVSEAGTYTVKAIGTGGDFCTDFEVEMSNGVTLQIKEITITTQPQSGNRDLDGNSEALTIVAESNDATEVLTYQWYLSKDNDNSTQGNDSLVGTSNATSYVPAVDAEGTFYYYVSVTSQCGTVVNSNVATIVVTDPTRTEPDPDEECEEVTAGAGCDGAAIVKTSVNPFAGETINTSVWASAPAIEVANRMTNVGNNAVACPAPGEDGSAGKWQAMYDNTNLYILVEGYEPDARNDRNDAWDGTTVEICTFTDNTYRQNMIGYHSKQFEGRSCDQDNEQRTRHLGTNNILDEDNVMTYNLPNEGGYQLAVTIPWTDLGTTPAAIATDGLPLEVVITLSQTNYVANCNGSPGYYSTRCGAFRTFAGSDAVSFNEAGTDEDEGRGALNNVPFVETCITTAADLTITDVAYEVTAGAVTITEVTLQNNGDQTVDVTATPLKLKFLIDGRWRTATINAGEVLGIEDDNEKIYTITTDPLELELGNYDLQATVYGVPDSNCEDNTVPFDNYIVVEAPTVEVRKIIWTNAGEDNEFWSNPENWMLEDGTPLSDINFELTEDVEVVLPSPDRELITGNVVYESTYPDMSDGFGDVKHSEEKHIHKMVVENGASTLIKPFIETEDKYYEVERSLVISDRLEWILVGPAVMPNGRELLSGDFYLGDKPHVYMRGASILEDDVLKWADPFANMYKPVLQDSCFAIRVPNQYGPSKLPSQIYSMPTFNNGDTSVEPADGTEPITFTFTGKLHNQDGKLHINAVAGKYVLACNTLMANIKVGNLTAVHGGQVQYWTFFNSDGSLQDFPETFKEADENTMLKPMQAFMFLWTGDTDNPEITEKELVFDEEDICVLGQSTAYRAARALASPTLEITAINGTYSSKSAVTYNEEFESDGFDYSKDFVKMFTDDVADIYTLLDGKRLSKQGFNSLADTINVGIRTQTAGIVSLAVSGADNFEEAYLEDKATGRKYDLKQENMFDVELLEGYNADRFILTFGKQSQGDDDDIITGIGENGAEKGLTIYTEDNRHVIISNRANNANINGISITSLSGSVLKSIPSAENSYIAIDMGAYPAGIYVVKATTNSETKNEKIIIR